MDSANQSTGCKNLTAIKSNNVVLLAVACLLLSACDWVDSTGIQRAPSTDTAVFIDDEPIGAVSAINEDAQRRVTTTRGPAGTEQTFEWSEEPVEQGNLGVCADQDGFNPELAADSVQQACANAEECELDFAPSDEETGQGVGEFSLAIPALAASVGVRYELVVTDEAGESTVSDHSFCLIAINEAPLAEDDNFSVSAGETLNVMVDTTPNLLSNDSDDTDVSNEPLRINSVAVTEPQFADSFVLGEDGSFTYQSTANPDGENRTDTFVYELSDGVFSVTATASIRIITTNEPPESTSFDPAMATEGEAYSIDLAPNFTDPEGEALSFTLSPDSPLADGTGLSLSTDGVLSGTPTSADVGSYSLVVVASDGLLSTSELLDLEIDAAPPINDEPNFSPVFVLGSVFSQSVVAGQPILPVAPQFTDVDTLTYTVVGAGTLPIGVSLDPVTGIVSGTPTQSGVFTGLRVRATDPSGAFAVSTIFSLTVAPS